jgi:hypothetical protein
MVNFRYLLDWIKEYIETWESIICRHVDESVSRGHWSVSLSGQGVEASPSMWASTTQLAQRTKTEKGKCVHMFQGAGILFSCPWTSELLALLGLQEETSPGS